MGDQEWDIFVCHSSADMNDVARPLANLLTSKGMKVWLDETEILVGDSLQTKIDAGLANLQFGIVILSPSFARVWLSGHSLPSNGDVRSSSCRSASPKRW